MHPPKSIFSTAQLRVPVFCDIRRYLTDKYFLTWFGGATPMDPQNQFFERLNLECQCFMILADNLQTNMLTWFGSATPRRGLPQKPVF